VSIWAVEGVSDEMMRRRKQYELADVSGIWGGRESCLRNEVLHLFRRRSNPVFTMKYVVE